MDYNHPRDDKSGRDSSQCYTYFNVCVCGGGGIKAEVTSNKREGRLARGPQEKVIYMITKT